VPLLGVPERAADTPESAALEENGILEGGRLPTVAWPVKKLSDLRTKPRCPEVFVRDADFEKVTGLRKSPFYQHSREKQDEIRAMIWAAK
jgi:hypothetical protein